MNPAVTAVVVIERKGAPEAFEWSTRGDGREVRERARAALEAVLAYDSALGFFAAPVTAARIVLRDDVAARDSERVVLEVVGGEAQGPWA